MPARPDDWRLAIGLGIASLAMFAALILHAFEIVFLGHRANLIS